jgi:hypothetical protein
VKNWHADPTDSDAYQEPFNSIGPDWNLFVVDPSRVVFVDGVGDASDPESLAFELALRSRSIGDGLIPIDRDTRYQGYDWYGSIPCVTGFELMVDGKSVDEFQISKMLSIVKSISVTFDVVKTTGESERIEWDALSFAAWGDCGDFSLLITEDSEWAKTRSLDRPFSLVYAAKYVGMSFSDDGDSYESQESDFDDWVEHELIEILGGAFEAARSRILTSLDWKVTEALAKANVTEFRVYKDPKKGWQVDVPTNVTKAA